MVTPETPSRSRAPASLRASVQHQLKHSREGLVRWFLMDGRVILQSIRLHKSNSVPGLRLWILAHFGVRWLDTALVLSFFADALTPTRKKRKKERKEKKEKKERKKRKKGKERKKESGVKPPHSKKNQPCPVSALLLT